MLAERMRPLLGTFVAIRARSGDRRSPQDLERVLALAFGAVARVHGLMSAQDPASDVSRVNGAAPGETVPVDAWTLVVLRRARDIWQETLGLFDPCAAPGVAGSFAHLELLPGAVRPVRRVRLTLDGIAKGFAVDQAVAALQAGGVSSGVVNAGGDLRIFGAKPEPVCVRHPARPGSFVAIGELREAAVATSGRYFGSSCIDPRSGRACSAEVSGTVVAADCTTADALTKPLLIDPVIAARALRRFGARALRLPAARAAA
jgi:thiamine biosynthesis lipoprotein